MPDSAPATRPVPGWIPALDARPAGTDPATHAGEAAWPGRAAASAIPSGSPTHPVTLVPGVDRTSGAPVTVLGIGNPIMGDDGIGLALLEALHATVGEREGVDWVNGITDGMELLPVVQDARYLLVLDAVAGPGLAPGSVRHLTGDQVPRLLSMKLSPHQVGLLDILAAARLLGKEPEAVEIVGVVPDEVDLDLALSPAARAGVQAAVPVAVEALEGLIERAQAAR